MPVTGTVADLAIDLWDPDASILLLGIRGTGKTSLAILAAASIGFRLVDADQNFYQATGLTRALYASKHGFEEYRKHELRLMRCLLQENPSRCIIVCGPGSAEGTGQELLRQFKKSHPVIYIMRDPDEVNQYLRMGDAAKIFRLTELISQSYRFLSNFEFYNLSELLDPQTQELGMRQQPPHHPSLTLKHVEQDFLRLIHSIRSQSSRPHILQARHSLSFLPPESKPFTYALTVPLDRVMDVAPQFRSIDLIVDALELVVDLEVILPDGKSLDHSVASLITKRYYTLRRNVRLPLIFHVQPPTGGRPINWSAYLDVLSHGLRLAPEYLTLDLGCDAVTAQQVMVGNLSTKIIGHFFDRNPDSDGWNSPRRLQFMERADEWGCDLVRLCQPVKTTQDNIAVQQFAAKARKSRFFRLPLIAYNVGHAGLNSCFMNSIFTPVAHELILDNRSDAATDRMLTVRGAQAALYASFVLDPLIFGIFGNAVKAALSPTMHNAAFQFCGMPHHYRTVQSSSLRDLEGVVRQMNFGGASVSSPFKQDIIPMLDYLSPEAQAIGAVNTLIPLRSKSLASLVDRNRAGPVVALFGDNTDWIGVHTCIRRNLSPVNAVKGRTTALILGAGGMARAAVYAAIRLGVQTIFIYNRTLSNARKLVKQFDGKSFSIHNLDLARASPSSSPTRSGTATPLDQKIGPVRIYSISSMHDAWPAGFEPPTIVVSCIPRVSENGEPLPNIVLPDAWLISPTGGVVIELAYNPINTPLIQQVQSLCKKGWIPVHGLQVLPEQGIAQFELFTGRKAPEHTMRAQVAKHVEGGF